MKLTAGHRGDDVRNDCYVELTPGNPQIRINSTVGAVYRRTIEAEVAAALKQYAPEGVGAIVEDFGAFGWCIEARIEAAACHLTKTSPQKLKSEFRNPKSITRRTRLYLPGNTPKFFINAKLYGADAVILDLEDAVPDAEKDEARVLVFHALRKVDFGSSERMVRINSGALGQADLAAVSEAGADSVLAPKVESAAAIEALDSPLPVVALIESAKGVANAMEIASARGVVALAIGVEDYLADTRGSRENPHAMAFAYGQIVNAARSAGISPLASVYADIDDLAGFRAEVARMISLGFDGVGCLHPSQVPIALQAFMPSDEEVSQARRILEAFESHGGALSVDGRMVDAPVAARARKLLERAQATLPDWRLA